MKRFIKIFILFIFISGLTDSCAARTVYVKRRPPAVIVEVKPAKPGPNYIWISGHWVWRGGKFVWVHGHWVKKRRGYVWVPGHWVKKPRGWVWIGGHWKKI